MLLISSNKQRFLKALKLSDHSKIFDKGNNCGDIELATIGLLVKYWDCILRIIFYTHIVQRGFSSKSEYHHGLLKNSIDRVMYLHQGRDSCNFQGPLGTNRSSFQ
jgi:hypothetical protein